MIRDQSTSFVVTSLFVSIVNSFFLKKLFYRFRLFQDMEYLVCMEDASLLWTAINLSK